jgi:hypothetical protein
MSGQLHGLATLPPGKEPLAFTESEAGWGPEPIWLLWRRGEYLLPLSLLVRALAETLPTKPSPLLTAADLT